jgi:hypothetical protein
MQVAALYDVHGNPPALDAVLGDERLADVDPIVLSGDVAAGPRGRPTTVELKVDGLGPYDLVRWLLEPVAAEEPTEYFESRGA